MERPAPRVSIVIPLFDEQDSIPELLGALDAVVVELEEGDRPTEVLVIDDGSRDDSWKLLAPAAESRPWLRLVRLRRNFGQTAAMSAGFDRAAGDYIVPMDADMQNDPGDIPKLIDRLEEGFDLVSGWRRDRKDGFLLRRLPSMVANVIISRISGLPLHDYGCTLKAYRREVLEPVNLYGEMHRFIPIYAKWAGAEVTEQVVQHHPRRKGKSKYGLERSFKVLLDLLTLRLLNDYSTKPLYFFGKWGAFSCTSGIAFGVVVLVQKFFYDAWAHRNPLLLLAIMLFLMGIQFFAIGLLAELQVRTYHESQHKPTYLVAEEVDLSCVESRESSLVAKESSKVASSAP